MNAHSLFGIWRNADGNEVRVSNGNDIGPGLVRLHGWWHNDTVSTLHVTECHAFLIGNGYLHVAH